MKVVIVGGVAAGASTGARVRRLDDWAEILILERGRYVSFANSGLPYHIGGEIPERSSLLLQTPENLAASLALDVRTGHDVVDIDLEAKEVEVHEVETRRIYREAYDKLVLCPGAGPIRPPIPGADLPQVDFAGTAFLSGGLITFHGFHRTPLEVGQGGFPIVAHAEDEMATRPGALEHV